SDDSDYEGETHVSRILREHADKREEAEMAKKIAELEMMPYESSSKSSSLSRATGASAAGSDSGSSSGYGNRSQYMRDRDAARRDPSSSGNGGGAGGEDYYSRSLRARGAGGDGATSPSISSMNSGVSNNSYGSSSSGGREPASANRYRTTSDLSRDDALSRLEGKSQGDKLATQVTLDPLQVVQTIPTAVVVSHRLQGQGLGRRKEDGQIMTVDLHTLHKVKVKEDHHHNREEGITWERMGRGNITS
ncbi:hypothetical protein BGZ95_006668, partial [Linnemannia exigua]